MKNVRKYSDDEIDTFLRMIIDTCPPIEDLTGDVVKEWDMDKWIERVKKVM